MVLIHDKWGAMLPKLALNYFDKMPLSHSPHLLAVELRVHRQKGLDFRLKRF
jgi:hypothetical protein